MSRARSFPTVGFTFLFKITSAFWLYSPANGVLGG